MQRWKRKSEIKIGILEESEDWLILLLAGRKKMLNIMNYEYFVSCKLCVKII